MLRSEIREVRSVQEAWVAFSGTLSGTHVARERRTTQQQSAKILRCVERSVRRGYISPRTRTHAARAVRFVSNVLTGLAAFAGLAGLIYDNLIWRLHIDRLMDTYYVRSCTTRARYILEDEQATKALLAVH